ncbi:MAG: polysaccharide deacetylase family protein [Bacteroidetes bacterium]|nr:MAG: polysaccharide deacetylase family protein [Bacteroidota bacterium]
MVVRNFLFHRVNDERDDLWPPMTPALFEKIIRSLTRTHHVVSLEEWLQEKHSRPAQKKLATVLFDDGYKDNIEYAAPVLKKYNCPASFYVVTDCINKNIPTWTYLLDHALQQTRIPTLHLDHEQTPGNLKEIALTDKALVRKIKPWMKKLANTHRVQVLNSILQQCGDVPLPENKMMSWEDIRLLQQAGFYIGSHSHTHPMLAALEDEKEIKEELSRSAAIITQELGKAPLTISYPIGSFDDRVIRLAGEVGYRFGLAVEQKFFHYGQDPIMTIPRVELYQESWWKLGLRMNGVYQKAKQLWQ